MKHIYTILFCLSLLMGCGGSESSNDEKSYSEMLIGEWEMDYTATQGSVEINIKTITTYKANGSERTEGILTFNNSGLSASAEYKQKAKWEIEGDVLTETITSIDLGEPKGDEAVFSGIALVEESLKSRLNEDNVQTILELTDSSITIKDETGTETTLQKVN